ncbi:MAG: hypothetical protein V4706_10410 [Pseudomonadota bacterium]
MQPACSTSFKPQQFTRLRAHQAIIMVINFFARRQTAAPERLSLEQLRERMYAALLDCKDMGVQRVIYRINVAATPTELWLLRSDLHQCIARVHDQAEATRRTNNLLDAFEGWVPSHQLTRIPESVRESQL